MDSQIALFNNTNQIVWFYSNEFSLAHMNYVKDFHFDQYNDFTKILIAPYIYVDDLTINRLNIKRFQIY